MFIHAINILESENLIKIEKNDLEILQNNDSPRLLSRNVYINNERVSKIQVAYPDIGITILKDISTLKSTAIFQGELYNLPSATVGMCTPSLIIFSLIFLMS